MCIVLLEYELKSINSLALQFNSKIDNIVSISTNNLHFCMSALKYSQFV